MEGFRMNRRSIASIAALLITSGSLSAQEKKPADPAQALIEQLVDVKEPYLGSQYYYAGGGAFLPYSHATACRAIKDTNDPLLALVKTRAEGGTRTPGTSQRRPQNESRDGTLRWVRVHVHQLRQGR